MLNASIDIAADGSLLYRSDLYTTHVRISRVADVYTFATFSQIDVGKNLAGLAVAGSGTRTVTVTAPTSLRIEMATDNDYVEVRGTGVATVVDFQAASQRLVLGNEEGVLALNAPIAVAASPGASQSRMTVFDDTGRYAPGQSPSYVITADSVRADDPDVQALFPGVTYSGLRELAVVGTRLDPTSSSLYLVRDTADGVVTTIMANGAIGADESTAPHVAVLGTSADPSSELNILANRRPVISLASSSSTVRFIDGAEIASQPGASIRVEGVRGDGYGLGADLVIQAQAWGSIDLSVANYWNPTRPAEFAQWTLGFDPGSDPQARYAALRDSYGPAASGIYFRPGELHSLNVDARGTRGASLLVDFRNGNPVPYDGPASGVANLQPAGLTYVGATEARPGASTSLALLGDVGSPFGSEVHTAMPLYRGVIQLAERGRSPRRIAYQLADGVAGEFEDSLPVDSYSYAYEIMAGTLPGDHHRRRAPDGMIVSAAVPSDLALTAGGPTLDGRNSIRIAERNPDAYMAATRINNKAKVDVLRRWSPASVVTTIDYASTAAVAGLVGLYLVDESPPAFASNDVARLQHLPPGAAVYVLQKYGDDRAFVSADGVAPASLVWLDGGTGTNAMEIDADGQVLRITPLGDDRFEVAHVVGGMGRRLLLYTRYQAPTIVNGPTATAATPDGVALMAASPEAGANAKARKTAGRS